MLAFVAAVIALPAWGQGTAKPGVLTVGFIPAEDSRAMVRQSQAILDIVAKHTGMKVDTFVGSDYNATIEALRAGHIDVALLGPFSYVLATTVAPVEAFAVTVIARTMQPSYQSIIIAPKDSKINSLADLKGKTFAFVDPGLDLRLHGALGGVHQGRHHAREGLQAGDVLGRSRCDHRLGGLGQGRCRQRRRPHLRARLRQGARGLQQAEGGLDLARRFPTTRCSTARTCPRT